MNIFIRYSVLTILFCLSSKPVIAAEKNTRFKVGVFVEANGTLKNRIESCVKKELQALEDVIVGDDKPDFSLVIVASEIKSKVQKKLGFALSVNTLQSYKPDETLKVLPKEYKELFMIEAADLVYHRGNDLLLTNDVNATCSEIVSNFDVQTLKPRRNDLTINEIMELIDKSSPKDR